MDGEKSLQYLEKALSGIPEAFAGKLLEVPVGTGVLTMPVYRDLPKEDVLPVMCNCDHLAIRAIHAILIREGTCVTSDHCDYCIVGNRNPLAAEYELVKAENDLLLSVKKNRKGFL